MTDPFEIRVEWLDAAEVVTPELAATWARYEVWAGGRCATYVEPGKGAIRRSVFGSVYPLAEWIAANWWTLNHHLRPTAVDQREWSWHNVRMHGWLRQHNMRAAGDGMAWPDLTLVPEGTVSHVVWVGDDSRSRRPVRFSASGHALMRADHLRDGLASFVVQVMTRLEEAGLPDTGLRRDWDAIASADEDEREYCAAVARLGFDPYAVDESLTQAVMETVPSLPGHLVGDFLDSADPQALREASVWLRRASESARRASSKATHDLSPIGEAIRSIDLREPTPWEHGYSLARQVRSLLNQEQSEPFAINQWVGLAVSSANSYGLVGVSAVVDNRCGLTLGASRSSSSEAFSRARALGRVIAGSDQREFLLTRACGEQERVAGAFAAELLAPAAGIHAMLDALGSRDDAVLEAIAKRYSVSPLLVRHQYENQILGVGGPLPSWPGTQT